MKDKPKTASECAQDRADFQQRLNQLGTSYYMASPVFHEAICKSPLDPLLDVWEEHLMEILNRPRQRRHSHRNVLAYDPDLIRSCNGEKLIGEIHRKVRRVMSRSAVSLRPKYLYIGGADLDDVMTYLYKKKCLGYMNALCPGPGVKLMGLEIYEMRKKRHLEVV